MNIGMHERTYFRRASQGIIDFDIDADFPPSESILFSGKFSVSIAQPKLISCDWRT